MPRAGFEPSTPATKLPQTYALDSAATAIGSSVKLHMDFLSHSSQILKILKNK
jgi:hypothetical protein